MSVHGQPEIDVGQDGRWDDDNPEVVTETREEASSEEAAEQNPPPGGYTSSEAPKSFSTWLREMPKSARYAAGGLGAAAVVAAAAFWAGSQMSRGEVENAQEVDNPPADVEGPDEAEGVPGNGSNNSAAEATEAAESGQTEQGEDAPETDTNNDTEDAESTEDVETRFNMNKDEWLQIWLDEDHVNGNRFEDLSPENRQGMEDYVNDVKSNFTRKLSVVANAETEEELRGDSVREVQYLAGMKLLVENGSGIFPVENPTVYGIRPRERDGESDEPAVWGWNERADSTAPDYDSFMIVYPDQNQEWQAISLHWFGASYPSDSNTRLVGAYMHTDYETPNIIRGILDWESLQTNNDGYVIENQNTPGSVRIENSIPSFNTTEEAWDFYEENGQYKPVSIEDLLGKITDA